MTDPVSLYTFPEDQDLSAFLGELRGRFPLALVESSEERATYLDTFDWRLMDAGYSLSAEAVGKRYRLALNAQEGGRLETLARSLPAFGEEVEDGRFRDTLSRLSKIRRLLPQAHAAWSRQLWAVLNEDEKTVSRILLRTGAARIPGERVNRPVAGTLRVLSLKGYDAEFREVVSALRRTGLRGAKDGNELAALLDALGSPPDRHSSSVVLPLSPGLRTDQACRLIHRELLATVQVNLDGVLKDLDSEFLHEFRVAGRRARSALTQVKGVFPQETVDRLKNELRWLGSRTGPTRDMDVYLLKIPSYQDALTDDTREDLIPLVRFLQKKKRGEQRKLVRSLGSLRFKRLMELWGQLAKEPDGPLPEEPPAAGRPVEATAREGIYRAYRKVLKRGGRIDWDTPPEALHQLRIDCKKLRYLMTFFQRLFPPEALTSLIGELKKLQDNLGNFNDLSVQARALHAFAEEMINTGEGPPATLLAMGQLMGQLEATQAVEREAFHGRFKTFARRKNRARFEELFG